MMYLVKNKKKRMKDVKNVNISSVTYSKTLYNVYMSIKINWINLEDKILPMISKLTFIEIFSNFPFLFYSRLDYILIWAPVVLSLFGITLKYRIRIHCVFYLSSNELDFHQIIPNPSTSIGIPHRYFINQFCVPKPEFDRLSLWRFTNYNNNYYHQVIFFLFFFSLSSNLITYKRRK